MATWAINVLYIERFFYSHSNGYTCHYSVMQPLKRLHMLLLYKLWRHFAVDTQMATRAILVQYMDGICCSHSNGYRNYYCTIYGGNLLQPLTRLHLLLLYNIWKDFAVTNQISTDAIAVQYMERLCCSHSNGYTCYCCKYIEGICVSH